MSAESFARMCAARRDKDNKYCADCNGRPPEVEVINMGGTIGKKNDRQDTERAGVELAAAAWSALMDRCKDAGFGEFASADPNVLAQQFMQAATEPARELDAAKKRIADLEAELATWQEANRKYSAEFLALNEDLRAEVERLRGELTEARQIIAQQEARREIGDGVDLSAAIYRDALADFAIRVLSGGVAVSFHEARP